MSSPNPTLPAALDALEFGSILQLIALEARSTPGKAAVMRRRPATSRDECELGQAELAEMVRYLQSEGSLPLGGLTDVAEIFDRESVPELFESWQVLRAARSTQVLRETFLRDDSFPQLRAIASGIDDLSHVIAEVGKYFTKEGKLKEDASPELRSLRSKIVARRNAIQKTLNSLMSAHEAALQ
jgi:DNA mismatch repair protein MutS2